MFKLCICNSAQKLMMASPRVWAFWQSVASPFTKVALTFATVSVQRGENGVGTALPHNYKCGCPNIPGETKSVASL